VCVLCCVDNEKTLHVNPVLTPVIYSTCYERMCLSLGHGTFHIVFRYFDSLSNYLQIFVNVMLQNFNVIRLRCKVVYGGFQDTLEGKKVMLRASDKLLIWAMRLTLVFLIFMRQQNLPA